MEVCAETPSLRAVDRGLHGPLSDAYHRMRNALQSLSNCAYLLARDTGVSPENAALLPQMQADVATVVAALRWVEAKPAAPTNLIPFTNPRREP